MAPPVLAECRLVEREQERSTREAGDDREPALLAAREAVGAALRELLERKAQALGELVGEGSALLAATHDERFVRDATDRRIELADGWILADEPVRPGTSAA